MRTNSDKTDSALNRLVDRLAADKKKCVIAAALIVLMIFMWIRLLGGKGPQSAGAAVLPKLTERNLSSPVENLKFVFVELPYVEGRHDVLARDFFRMDGQFSGTEASIVSTDSGKDGAREVAQGLRLEAISMGPQSEAFINDKLVKVGDMIVVEGSKSYQCQVKSIRANSVIVKYGETEIELKLKQPD
jgi:hypothetical protein